MRISEIMQQNVITVRPEDTLSTASQMMLWCGCRHLPVVDGHNMAGVLSDRDILRYDAKRGSTPGLVRDAMSGPAKTARPEDTIAEAASRMANEKIGCLPVLQGKALVGIVTTSDLLSARQRTADSHAGDQPTAAQIMTRAVVTASVDDHLDTVVAKMGQLGIRHMPVVDGDRKVVGFLSDRDLRLPPEYMRQLNQERAYGYLRSTKVRSVMSQDVTTVAPHTPLNMLVTALTDWRLSALPVVEDDGQLAGIVSYVDVLRVLGRYHMAHEVSQHFAPFP